MKPGTPLAKRDLSYVFLISIGRAGSTVVNAILNSIEGYDIRGENRSALFKLYETIATVEKVSRHHRPATINPGTPFYGAKEVRASKFRKKAAAAFVDQVLVPPTGTRVTGFKEIRFGPKHMTEEEFEGYLAFLNDTFPGAKFVFNLRQAEDILKSGWWAGKDTEKAGRYIETTRKWFLKANDRLPNAHLLEYETYKGNPDAFAPLFAFLGEPFDRAAVEAILSTPLTHGQGEGKGKKRKRRAVAAAEAESA